AVLLVLRNRNDLLRQHSSINMQFGGLRSPLNVCGLAAVKVEPASLFSYLTRNRKLICTSVESSPIRHNLQVLVATNSNHKRRMVIAYSQTINRHILLDAYSLQSIEQIVNDVANYTVFSTIAFHQIPIRTEDRKYTEFEAGGQLFQFKRIPFEVKNGVDGFQRKMNYIIRQENVEGTFSYLDDVTVCGKDLEEHGIAPYLTLLKALNESLHSIRSLPFTAANETPHKRMFRFVRNGNGSATPSWLTIPLVQEASLIKGNHEYTHISFPDGRDSTVSTRNLASLPSIDENGPDHPDPTVATHLSQNVTTPPLLQPQPSVTTPQSVTAPPPQNVASRHSSRMVQHIFKITTSGSGERHN
ncbi:hypothetical protein ILUMI_13777, partial [Ignelater luminosus]